MVATVSVPASVVRAVAQGHRPAEVAAGALQAFAYLVSIGLVIQIVVAALAHEPITVRGAFAALRPRAGRLAVTSLMVGAVVLLGTFTLLLPGVLFYTWFAFAVPIAVLEDHRVMHSMAISRDTVRGSWWRVFGILLLALVIESISSGVVQNACSPVTDTSVGANVVVTTLAGLVLDAGVRPDRRAPLPGRAHPTAAARRGYALTIRRKPMCRVEVSTASPCRAAGR